MDFIPAGHILTIQEAAEKADVLHFIKGVQVNAVSHVGQPIIKVLSDNFYIDVYVVFNGCFIKVLYK